MRMFSNKPFAVCCCESCRLHVRPRTLRVHREKQEAFSTMRPTCSSVLS